MSAATRATTADNRVCVILPPPIRQEIGGQRCLTLSARTVGELIAQLKERCRDAASVLLDEAGNLRPTVRLYLNDSPLVDRQLHAVCLPPNSVVRILPILAGG